MWRSTSAALTKRFVQSVDLKKGKQVKGKHLTNVVTLLLIVTGEQVKGKHLQV